jgi:hypothetical protein
MPPPRPIGMVTPTPSDEHPLKAANTTSKKEPHVFMS